MNDIMTKLNWFITYKNLVISFWITKLILKSKQTFAWRVTFAKVEIMLTIFLFTFFFVNKMCTLIQGNFLMTILIFFELYSNCSISEKKNSSANNHNFLKLSCIKLFKRKGLTYKRYIWILFIIMNKLFINGL